MGARVWARLLYCLRLAGFAVLSFVIIGGGVMLYEDYKAVLKDTAPTRSTVEIPDGLPFEVEEVTFTGGEDLTMSGWFVPPQNGGTIILLHGYGGDRRAMIWHAAALTEAGYGVLMYDQRASGESDGERRSYGWEDPADVGGAIVYLNDRPEVDPERIGIAGCSIGGQIALQGAAYHPEIGAVWADGPSPVTSADLPAPANWASGIYYVSSHVMDWMLARRLGVRPPAPMISIIGTIAPRPLMLVAGGRAYPHLGSEAQQIERYAQFAGDGTQVWVIAEALHCDGPAVRPEEYATRMVDFFDAGLGIE
jgi:pimeloyl-ACP methyl ester carboxylesterase